MCGGMGRISKGRNKVRVFHGGRIRGGTRCFPTCDTELTTEEKNLDRFGSGLLDGISTRQNRRVRASPHSFLATVTEQNRQVTVGSVAYGRWGWSKDYTNSTCLPGSAMVVLLRQHCGERWLEAEEKH